ncbi:MAG TPA: PaaI family thioesterase [Terriglobales bacterium]|nr:PaaI family thioesterase [Terriglobales bacterium]
MSRNRSAVGHSSRTHSLKKNFCFGCGHDNSEGMHLKFSLDRETRRVVGHFRLSKRYTGPPGYCHGGIIATILDEAMSKLSKFRDVIAPTAKMIVEYRKLVPLHKRLRVEAHEIGKRGRRLTRVAQIVDEKGTVLARSSGVFVVIDPERVFAPERSKPKPRRSA